MSGLRAVIAAIYRQVDAPDWAAPNLDGLADILRDLSWLPAGPVDIAVPRLDALTAAERHALQSVLHRAQMQTRTSPRPVRAEPGRGRS